MGQQIRPGGIDILGDIPWGTHFCQFYQTKEDLLDILIPYFKSGLENNEFCMWITAEPLEEQEAEEALRKTIPDFDRYQRNGQIEIWPHKKWYLKDGVFNSERVLNGLMEKLNLAQSRSFAGLRFTENTDWLGKSDWQNFTDYETTLNGVIGQHKIIAICSYSLEQHNASELLDVFINHHFSIIKRSGEWKIIESGERKQSAQKLRRLREQYHIMLRTIMDGFWVVDTQGHFLEVNDAYCQLTGYSKQELLSMSVPNVEALERPEDTAAHIRKIIQNGADHFETSHRCKNGRIVHLEVNATYSDVNGGQIYVFFRDVTEHRQADEELRQSEKRYHELFVSMQEGFYLAEQITDDTGNIIDFRFLEVNPAYEAIVGMSRDKVIGRTVNELFPWLGGSWLEAVSRVVSTGEPTTIEGFVKKIRHYYQNHYYSPRPGQFASIFTDITKYKQAEKALRQARDELEIRVQKRTEELKDTNNALLAEIADRKRAEESVKAERQRFNDALETLPAYLILLSPDYHVPFANRFFRERFGESHGKRCFEYLFGRTEPCEICETYKVLKTMKPLEWEWTGPDNHNYYVYDFPFTDTDGSTLIMEVGIDVTRQKQAEKALRKAYDELDIRVQERTSQLQESEEKYRSIVETANEGILIIDLNGIITYTNQRMAELLGYAQEELLGRVGMDFMDADQKTDVLSTREVLKKGSKTQREFRFRRKDGSVLWTNASSSPLLDNQGHHFANLTMYSDSTERKKAEADLAYLASFPELNPMPILELDTAGNAIYLNPTTKTLFPDLLSQGSKHAFLANWDSMVNAVRHEDTHLLSRDINVGGSWYEQTLVYMPLNQRFRLYSRDITERKHAEEELFRVNRALRAISACDQAMVRATDEQTLLSDVCRIICVVAGYRMAWVGVVEHDDAKSIRPLAWGGVDDGYLATATITWADTKRGRGPTGLAARTGETHSIQDFVTEPSASPWRAAALARGYRSSIAMPLFDAAGNVFEVFSLYSDQPNSFTPTEVELLEKLTADLAFGINVLRDRRKRKHAEESLLQEKNFTDAVIDSLPSFFYIVDRNGYFVRCNKDAEKVTGYTLEELSRMHCLDVIAQKDRDLLARRIEDVFDLGQATAEANLLTKNGTEIPHYFTGARVNIGESPYLLGMSIDIAERKQVEGELQETRDYLDNLLDYANAPIIVWDPDFCITRFNHAFERLTGLKAEDVLNKKLEILFPQDRRDESMSHIQRTIVGERWEVMEIPVLRRNSEVRTVLWNSASIYAPDGRTVIATIAQGQDITERKEAEEALKSRTDELARSNAELEQFAYVASHDLQEPLRMVSSYVKLLAKRYQGKLDQDADEFINYAYDGATRMQRLINDLLAYSRVGTRGKKFQEVDLETALVEALDNLKVTIMENKAVVTHDHLPSVYGDARQLTQVFQNLIDNAIKFHGEESPRIHISAKVNEGECVCSVSDNGIGIAQEYYQKVFVLFQRLHTRTEYPGTGIGLSICKRIAERHGGRIWVESKPGVGSCFYFAIPASAWKE